MTSTNSAKQRQGKDFQLKLTTLGCVKWFNNRSGYGFIVAIGDQANYGDVFVHHSQLRISDPNVYKTLNTGEYVEFEISPTSDGKHKYQANNVTGVYGGKLMCENAPSPLRRPSRRSLEPTNTETSSQTQPTYTILQRPQKSSSPSISTSEPISQESLQQEKVVLPRSRKPRQPNAPRRETSTPPSGASPPPVLETPYKNAIKRTTPNKPQK
jgi:cold shock CspA family protein